MAASLRRQFTIHLSRILLLIWLVTTILAFFAARNEVTEVFDERMQQYAGLLTEIAYRRIHDLEDRGIDVGIHPPGSTFSYNSQLTFRVWRRGALVAMSTGVPDFPKPDKPGFYYRRMMSYDDRHEHARGDTSRLEEEDWVLFAQYDQKYDLWVVVAEIDDAREILIGKMILQMVWPVLVVFPVMLGALYYSIHKQLRPLRRITRQIGRRSPSDLSAIDVDDAPAELFPVIDSLNQLLNRLGDALQSERRFTANASHELRTPLAALLTQVQIAERQCSDKDQKASLAKIKNRVDRLTHLVDQLLTLARFDPKYNAPEMLEFGVMEACEATLTDMAKYADSKNIELVLDVSGQSKIIGIEAYFTIMLRNLVDNAVRYSAGNSKVHVLFKGTQNQYELRVIDEGRGVPDKDKKRIFEYFSRGQDEQSFGSGIGLSIVKRIADQMRGEIKVEDNPGGGAIFSVVWRSSQ